MRNYVVLLAFSAVIAANYGLQPKTDHRLKRSASGALQIITNHAQPIHADVKPENIGDTSEKPCSEVRHEKPSRIEPGVVFQVTPPQDSTYQVRSLRKSLPLANKLDLVRSINRVVTVFVLLVSVVFEFYPLLRHLYFLLKPNNLD